MLTTPHTAPCVLGIAELSALIHLPSLSLWGRQYYFLCLQMGKLRPREDTSLAQACREQSWVLNPGSLVHRPKLTLPSAPSCLYAMVKMSWRHRHPRKGKKLPAQGEQLSVLKCKSAQYVPHVYIPHASMQMKSHGTGPSLTAFFPLLQISWVLMPVNSLWYAPPVASDPSILIVRLTLLHCWASACFCCYK